MTDKYNQSSITGDKYTRAREVRIVNASRPRSISFMEEDVFVVDGKQIVTQAGSLSEMFTEANANTSFALLNPLDGTPLGASMTFQELYVALYSLYIDRATARDAASGEP